MCGPCLKPPPCSHGYHLHCGWARAPWTDPVVWGFRDAAAGAAPGRGLGRTDTQENCQVTADPRGRSRQRAVGWGCGPGRQQGTSRGGEDGEGVGCTEAYPSAPRIAPVSCHRPEPGGVRGASSSTSLGCWLPGPGAHRPSRRPPPCVSASLLRHLHPGLPRGSSTSDAPLTFTGKTLSHRSWGSGPQHVSEDLRSAHSTISAAVQLPSCRLGHALSQAAFSGLPCPSWPSSRKPSLPVSWSPGMGFLQHQRPAVPVV